MAIRLQAIENKQNFFSRFSLRYKFPFISKKKFPFYSSDMQIAHKYCTGRGVELGAAAHNPFNLPGSINLAPFSHQEGTIDSNDFLFFQKEQGKICGHFALIDVVGEAHATGLPDCSQDYLISSHVVEHLPDLISAFLEWNRILKPNGIIFMIFPKRNADKTDQNRPITPLYHFVEDFYWKRDIHTHTIACGHGIRGHYHVFNLQSMLELISWCNYHLNLSWHIEHVEETDSKVGNGHTVVARFKPQDL